MDIREVEYPALLDYYCDSSLPILTPEVRQIAVGIKIPGESQARGFHEAFNIQTPLFRHLHQAKSLARRESVTKLKEAVADMEQQLGAASSSKISRLVDFEKGDIDTARPLHTYGIDLLSAIEIRSWLRRDLDADIASFEILGDSSIAEVVGIVVTTKSGYIKSSL